MTAELESVGFLATNVEKLGIIGIMAIGLIYFGYIQNTALKQMTKALEELRDISKELARGNETLLGRVEHRLIDVESELKDTRRVMDTLLNIVKVRKDDCLWRGSNRERRIDDDMANEYPRA